MNLSFTTSKLLAYMIFIMGSIVSIYLQSQEVFVTSITMAAALMAVKTGAQTYERIKKE